METSVPVSTSIQSTSNNEDSSLNKINPETGENYKPGDHYNIIYEDGTVEDVIIGW